MSSHLMPIYATTAIIAAAFMLVAVAAPVQSAGANPKRWSVPQAAPVPQEIEAVPAGISLYPQLTIDGGSSQQHSRLALAVSRFSTAGLELPDLLIVFASGEGACQGHYGLYQDDQVASKITFCSDVDFVYEHELAHAWDAHAATDDQRQAFMDLRGYKVWASGDVPWSERGIEDAAFIIQQTVGGLRLPSVLTEEFNNRSAAFEALTGRRDPRLPQPVAITLEAVGLS